MNKMPDSMATGRSTRTTRDGGHHPADLAGYRCPAPARRGSHQGHLSRGVLRPFYQLWRIKRRLNSGLSEALTGRRVHPAGENIKIRRNWLLHDWYVSSCTACPDRFRRRRWSPTPRRAPRGRSNCGARCGSDSSSCLRVPRSISCCLWWYSRASIWLETLS